MTTPPTPVQKVTQTLGQATNALGNVVSDTGARVGTVVRQTTNTAAGAVGGVARRRRGAVKGAGSGISKTVTGVTQGLGGTVSRLGH